MQSSGKSLESFSCDACGKQFRWKRELANRKVKCPCGQTIRVPGTSAPPPPPVPVSENDPPDLAGMDSFEPQNQYDINESTAASPPPPPPPRVPKAVKSNGKSLFSTLLAGGSRREKLVGIALAIGAIGLAVFCYFMQVKHDAFMKVAQETVANIDSEVSISKSGKGSRRLNPDNWTFKFEAAYTIDGKSYREEVDMKGDNLPPGWDPEDSDSWGNRQFKLLYDPQNPTTVEAAVAAKGRSWLWGYLISVGMLGYGGWNFLKANAAE